MAKLSCKCGNLISLPGEGDNEFTLMPNRDMSSIGDLISQKKMDADIYFDRMLDVGIAVCFCEKCKRMWVEDMKNKNGRYNSYIPEF